jgi:hypothetical protein
MNDAIDSKNSAFDRKALLMLMVRMTVYYLVVAILLTATARIFPSFLENLPVGGVGEIAGYDDPGILELEEALLGADIDELDQIANDAALRPGWFDDARTLLFAMFGTLILMLPVSWVYKGIHDDGAHDHSLDETTLILPAVVAGIVLVVQHSLALAFSLAGIVAGVQFRRALSDTFDTLFIFVAIGVGIAAGIRALEIAAVLSIFFNYATVLVCIFGDGLESHYLSEKKRKRQIQKRAEESLEDTTPDENQP